jgi:hypothetical protein
MLAGQRYETVTARSSSRRQYLTGSSPAARPVNPTPKTRLDPTTVCSQRDRSGSWTLPVQDPSRQLGQTGYQDWPHLGPEAGGHTPLRALLERSTQSGWRHGASQGAGPGPATPPATGSALDQSGRSKMRRADYRIPTAIPPGPIKAYRFPIGFLAVDLTPRHTNLLLLVAGPTIRLSSRHAKVRRHGYPRS